MIEIFISPSENLGFVWNADDWLKLRKNYRIIGDLVGSLSKYPRQNSFNGLPLCLQPEEISLLKEKGYAKLINCPTLASRPHDNLHGAFEEKEKEFNESQRLKYIHRKEVDVRRSYHSIIEGRQQKHSNFDPNNSDKNALIKEEVNKIQSVFSNNSSSCTTIDDPWLKEEEKFESNWSYPTCEKERVKYEVFKDLWEKNYYITSGTKFGGDFLCYSGDPAKFHAEFVIVCMEFQEKLTVKDLVMFGRIGSSTKKTVVLASFDGENIIYQSLKWIDKIQKTMNT